MTPKSDYASIARLTDEQRYQASDRMTEHGLNKCFDCCLVPGCPNCGPCHDHDEPTEAKAVFAWAASVGLDGAQIDSSEDEK
jgi:hypothetical protein